MAEDVKNPSQLTEQELFYVELYFTNWVALYYILRTKYAGPKDCAEKIVIKIAKSKTKTAETFLFMLNKRVTSLEWNQNNSELGNTCEAAGWFAKATDRIAVKVGNMGDQVSRKIKEILKDKISEGKITAKWIEDCLPPEYKRKYTTKSEVSSLSKENMKEIEVDASGNSEIESAATSDADPNNIVVNYEGRPPDVENLNTHASPVGKIGKTRLCLSVGNYYIILIIYYIILDKWRWQMGITNNT